MNLWKGKGDKVIYSSRFLCTNTDYEEPLVAVPAPTVPLPGPNPDTSPDPRTWRALGEGYQNFIALVQSSYQHLANLQNAHITSTGGQLARTRGRTKRPAQDEAGPRQHRPWPERAAPHRRAAGISLGPRRAYSAIGSRRC